MIGLIIKDILANKKYLYIMGGVTVFYILYGIMLENTNFYIPFLMLFCTMFILSSFTYDDMAGWDMYALTMPTSKDQIIYAKYLLSFLFTILASILSILVNVLNLVLRNQTPSIENYIMIWIYVAIALLFNSIQIPLVVKMGTEKARFAILGIIFIPTLLIMGIEKIGKIEALKQMLISGKKYYDIMLILSPFVILLVILLSARISIQIYRKKEY